MKLLFYHPGFWATRTARRGGSLTDGTSMYEPEGCHVVLSVDQRRRISSLITQEDAALHKLLAKKFLLVEKTPAPFASQAFGAPRPRSLRECELA